MTVVAQSAAVPQVELALGLKRLQAVGMSRVRASPEVRKQHLFYAGSDAVRARAVADAILSPASDVIWSARGGSGATRILGRIEAHLAEALGVHPAEGAVFHERLRAHLIRRKLWVGFSDATAMLEFARERLGFSVLHAPMVASRDFSTIATGPMGRIVGLVNGNAAALTPHRLRSVSKPREASGTLIGGNLSVLSALVGTPWAPRCEGRILFLEDVTEPLYRLDRMMGQLRDSGALTGLQGIVLGTFDQCEDRVPTCLKSIEAATRKKPRAQDLKPLRKAVPVAAGLRAIFGSIGEELGIPVWEGLPCGHGQEGHEPLPLGARVRVTAGGEFTVQSWDWILSRK